jgi:hypothetical protein
LAELLSAGELKFKIGDKVMLNPSFIGEGRGMYGNLDKQTDFGEVVGVDPHAAESINVEFNR